MSQRIALVAAAAILGSLTTWSAPAGAASCPHVFVPEGYASTCRTPRGREEGWRLEVVAEPAPLGELARLTVRPVDEPVLDPFSWLQEQLVVDLNGFRGVLTDLLEHPDNPLSQLFAPELIDDWLERLGLLGHLPLRGCAYPFERVGTKVWQMDCRWAIGPVEQLVRLQLVDAENEPYLITIWTVDERRQRHLQAIANSIEWNA